MRKATGIMAAVMAVVMLAAVSSCNEKTTETVETTEQTEETTEMTEEIKAPETEPAETESEAERLGYVIVTDYVTPKKNVDCSDEINKLILENPNKTIYFPDGDYYISAPIVTPADPKKSVDLRLSNYAHIVAVKYAWGSQGALVQLGGIEPYNDTATPGSNYSLTGGILDGNGEADGVAIMSGRETKVTDVSIKSVHTGLYIAYGANSGSSDCDISNLSITGCGGASDVGIYIEGYDNTLTNIRISKVHTGVRIKSQANMLRNIHPLYCSDFSDYGTSVGFIDESGCNFFDNCYSDQFETGFKTLGNTASRFTDCFVFWWSTSGGTQTAFKAVSQFNSVVNGLTIGFKSNTTNTVLSVGKDGGNGKIRDAAFNESIAADKTYKNYLEGEILRYGW